MSMEVEHRIVEARSVRSNVHFDPDDLGMDQLSQLSALLCFV